MLDFYNMISTTCCLHIYSAAICIFLIHPELFIYNSTFMVPIDHVVEATYVLYLQKIKITHFPKTGFCAHLRGTQKYCHRIISQVLELFWHLPTYFWCCTKLHGHSAPATMRAACVRNNTFIQLLGLTCSLSNPNTNAL